jgi:hypothetical protein
LDRFSVGQTNFESKENPYWIKGKGLYTIRIYDEFNNSSSKSNQLRTKFIYLGCRDSVPSQKINWLPLVNLFTEAGGKLNVVVLQGLGLEPADHGWV